MFRDLGLQGSEPALEPLKPKKEPRALLMLAFLSGEGEWLGLEGFQGFRLIGSLCCGGLGVQSF